ncbi:hypothetical protein GMOD_00006986 [Pyrenophora seminiperda CCB06]|uniref:Uncharacterized protein n=1 Tax=Pyrenophora seminiperda CCB06 TaxID=1302712 RepID=A0A3M7MC90_9PLEO|nr:hypothetical protein GMOD_00006986 [Pyrenophora seminiperda CCB06]
MGSDMTRSDHIKDAFRETAAKLIMNMPTLRLANEETTELFKFKDYPEVRGVVVDKGSDRGYIQVSGGRAATTMVETSKDKTGVEFVEILKNQGCMLYGGATVLFCYPEGASS